MRLPEHARRTVLYGHDAKTGFVRGRYTIGLDSGCVRGGALTAAVIEAGPVPGSFRYSTVQVPCEKPAETG
ncbi:hypothetical protein CDD83_10584 [Cordyceps sp. RAO-2017]|nr:hypothetical protein CDD83_10584 [Cordyceps sp. RAO-2017]